MKKIDDFIEKHTVEWCEKNKDKFLELGSFDACMSWFKKTIIFAVFVFFMFISVFCIEFSVKNIIREVVGNALLSYVLCTILFFIADKTDKGDTE